MKIYSGRNYVPKFRGKLFEVEDLKMTKIRENWPRKQYHAHWAHGVRQRLICNWVYSAAKFEILQRLFWRI